MRFYRFRPTENNYWHQEIDFAIGRQEVYFSMFGQKNDKYEGVVFRDPKDTILHQSQLDNFSLMILVFLGELEGMGLLGQKTVDEIQEEMKTSICQFIKDFKRNPAEYPNLVREELRCASFSTINDNVQIWREYAGLNGICIEYQKQPTFYASQAYAPYSLNKVFYDDSIRHISYTDLLLLKILQALHASVEVDYLNPRVQMAFGGSVHLHVLTKALERIFLTKERKWSHESEFRSFDFGGTPGYACVPDARAIGIVAGPEFENFDCLERIVRGRVPIYQCRFFQNQAQIGERR